MKKPFEFYKNNIEKYSTELERIKKKLMLSSMLRLTIFVLGCVAVYFLFGNNGELVGVLVLTAVLFGVLVSRHGKLKYQRDFLRKLILQNEVEFDVLNRNFHYLPEGSEYKNPTHEFSQDIDLFGRGSFFQYINRTTTTGGSDYLAFLLTENSVSDIPEKQAAIQELSALPDFRQKYAAIASLVKTKISGKDAASRLEKYVPFAPKWVLPVSLIFSLGSLGIFIGNYFGVVSIYITIIWLFTGWAIHGRFSKKIGILREEADQLQNTFEQFYKVLICIENQEFVSEVLIKKRKAVLNANQKSSAILKKFARGLDVLDQGNIMIFGALLNGFFLRDLRQCYHLESWIKMYKTSVPQWFEAITFFDSYNSLGNFAFNHPQYVFPKIVDNSSVLNVKGAGHPLLQEETMVRNDFQISFKQFFIVTGANMAGKSTFLRTVSLQIVMGNIGLPVCAESSEYKPVKLITSMRTTDSLTDDESYFFSELKRLKFIVDKIETDRYFIILDEILKGTNSTDKAIGSRKFVEKLVAGESTGIIATHDLSLCEVANEKPEVENYFFDAQIENDELFFDYTLKLGICQNMNASFLLKKMNIVD